MSAWNSGRDVCLGNGTQKQLAVVSLESIGGSLKSFPGRLVGAVHLRESAGWLWIQPAGQSLEPTALDSYP